MKLHTRSSRTMNPCGYFKEYKAIVEPKCNCQPCWDKWINRIWISAGPLNRHLYRRLTKKVGKSNAV
jgi:hypothetical protein